MNAGRRRRAGFELDEMEGLGARPDVVAELRRADATAVRVVEADLPAALTAPQITRICDRNWGVGSDGILLLTAAWDGADFGLRILNPDGSEAEKSGNGLRIFAKWLRDHGHAKQEQR